MEVDGRGTARIECSMDEEVAGSTDATGHVEGQGVNDSDKTVAVAEDESSGNIPKNDAKNIPRIFFFLKVRLSAVFMYVPFVLICVT